MKYFLIACVLFLSSALLHDLTKLTATANTLSAVGALFIAIAVLNHLGDDE